MVSPPKSLQRLSLTASPKRNNKFNKMGTQFRVLKLLGIVAFVWVGTRQVEQTEAKGTVLVNYQGMCVGPYGPERCPEYVCPDRCPDFYDPSDPTLNQTGMKETCFYDCQSPSCLTSCQDSSTGVQVVQCKNPNSRCYGKWLRCPRQCPYLYPDEWDLAASCFPDCDSPHCNAICWRRKFIPNCDNLAAACYDPRFVGGDGGVFLFHGQSNQSFSLVSDPNVQINGHFIGHRPKGRPRDFTWVQALGILFRSHILSLEATKSQTWDEEVDHLRFTYNGESIIIPEMSLSRWYSPDGSIKLERISSRNNVMVTLEEKVEIFVNVVPVTAKDDKIHNYQLPVDDCYAHLEVQFRFLHLSPVVDGVLGRTYRPDFEGPTNFGRETPTLGDHERYRTTSIFSSDCRSCVFSQQGTVDGGVLSIGDYPVLNCSTGAPVGYGISCKK